ncbi:MAG: uncharacterized protein QOG96_2143, partial [Pseudonocardiales bacterium]|nr:uncharacterized protein [Pseudonocardiales bacterium]
MRPGEPPSWHAALSFTVAYAAAVWKALVAALLISAAVQAWVPRAWLLRLLDRPGRVRSAAVAYWLGNPLLNPAVLVFLVLVAPWQWVVTRALVGLLLVVGGAATVSWL